MTSRWYALHTAPGREFLARDELRMSGYRCHLPTIDKQVRVSGRSKREKIVQEALFRRYVFCNMIPWREMNLTDKRCFKRNGRRIITGVLGMGDTPYAFTDKQMLAILENAALAKLVPVSDTAARALPLVGEPCLITSGPFEGQKGTVVALDKSKATVEFAMLRAGKVSVPIKSVEAAA